MTDELTLMRGELERLTEENTDLTRELKSKLRREQLLNHKLAEALGETESIQYAEKVLAHFNARFGRKLRWIPDGTNARVIARAIRCYDSPEEGVAACFEAIDGLACRPYLVRRNGFTERAAHGTERQRKDDLKYALGGDIREQLDETAIERYRSYAREAREEGMGIPKWGPVVAKEHLDEAVEMCVAKDRALGVLREFVEVQSAYIVRLEEASGLRLQDTLVAA